MKKHLIVIIGILLSIKMSAQTAEDYLNSVIEKQKSYNDISVIFNHRIINTANGINENMNGYGSIKGDSYIINVGGQVLISNGEILWNYLIDEEEVMISEVNDDNSSSPLAIIDSFTENVNVNFIENDNANTTSLLIKENENDTFDKILITVDNKDLKIKDIHLFTPDGIEFIYEITDFKTNQNLPDNMFIFDEKMYPNVEVIDMR